MIQFHFFSILNHYFFIQIYQSPSILYSIIPFISQKYFLLITNCFLLLFQQLSYFYLINQNLNYKFYYYIIKLYCTMSQNIISQNDQYEKHTVWTNDTLTFLSQNKSISKKKLFRKHLQSTKSHSDSIFIQEKLNSDESDGEQSNMDVALGPIRKQQQKQSITNKDIEQMVQEYPIIKQDDQPIQKSTQNIQYRQVCQNDSKTDQNIKQKQVYVDKNQTKNFPKNDMKSLGHTILSKYPPYMEYIQSFFQNKNEMQKKYLLWIEKKIRRPKNISINDISQILMNKEFGKLTRILFDRFERKNFRGNVRSSKKQRIQAHLKYKKCIRKITKDPGGCKSFKNLIYE